MTEITLTHSDARATIALLGAEARSWRIAGRDLLWPGDPAIWSDISPILYPVVGWTRGSEERVDGVRYPLGLHGFARFLTHIPLTIDDARDSHRCKARVRGDVREGRSALLAVLEFALGAVGNEFSG